MKTGTHTVHSVGNELAGKTKPIVSGHLIYESVVGKLKEMGYENPELAMHVRDPVKRMISVLNHQFGRRRDRNSPKDLVDLDRVLMLAKENPKAVFPPQIHFWNKKVKLYPFDFSILTDFWNYEEDIPHEFPGEYRLTPSDIEGHEIYNYIMIDCNYQRDYELLNRLEKERNNV